MNRSIEKIYTGKMETPEVINLLHQSQGAIFGESRDRGWCYVLAEISLKWTVTYP
jgi:hypothetical protein